MFAGTSCGAPGETFGEICFNTALEGYLEVITDPSYAGQIVTMTYPQIGNYGVAREDLQRDTCALKGLVVRDMCRTPSNFRSNMTLPEFLWEQNIVAIEGVDTRALVRHVRDHGAQRAVISTVDTNVQSLLRKVRSSKSIVGQNLVQTVSCTGVHDHTLYGTYPSFIQQPATQTHHVVVYDCGVKTSILDNLVRAGCKLTVVPWNTPAPDVLALKPNGVFFSNGPGDPDAVQATYYQATELLGKVPIFGICMGHQMLCKAAGATMEKLKFGHRGANQPVVNLRTKRVEISVQNHGFGLVFSSLGPLVPDQSGGISSHAAGEDLRMWVREGIAPVVANDRFGRIQLTHVNLNDGTPEGIAFLDVPAFSVQYHPEASPGSTDSHYLFRAFSRLMSGADDYLNIDIAKERLAGWRFGTSNQQKRVVGGVR